MRYSNFRDLIPAKTWRDNATAVVDERLWYIPWKKRRVEVFRAGYSRYWRRLDDGNFVDHRNPDQVQKLEEKYIKEQELIDKIAGLK